MSPAAKPTGRGRRRVDLRREEILTATLEQVDRLGLAATRVVDVARALGVSPALVFYHFKTKDALVAAAFEHAEQRDLARLDKALGDDIAPVDRLRRLLRLYGPTGTAPGWRLWIDAWALALREPVIRRVLRRLNDRWNAVFLAVVRSGVADGSFRCADPVSTAARMGALIDGLAVANLVHRSVTRAQLHQWVAESVAVELGLDVARLT